MSKTVEVQIGETTFYVTPPPPMVVARLATRFQKLVAGPMAALSGTSEDDVAALFLAVSSSLDEATFDYWEKALLTKDIVSVEINGTVMKLDEAAKVMAFSDYTVIYELLGRIMKEVFFGPLPRWLNRSGSGLNELMEKLSAATANKPLTSS